MSIKKLTLNKWEGVINWVKGDEFGVTLKNLFTFKSEKEIFVLMDVSDYERHLVVPGATFSLEIGYEISNHCRRVSVLKMHDEDKKKDHENV